MNKQKIINLAEEEFAASRLNSFAALGYPQEKIWEKVDTGFAAGDDPLFAFFKEDIGAFYWSPSQAFNQVYLGANIPDRDLSVLSIGFYMGKILKEKQRAQTDEPSMCWMYSRNSWEPFVEDFSRRFVDRLAKEGVRVAAIDLAPGFSWQESKKYGKASNWSQRHTAYVAGLGTFGLCDGLISRNGKAARYSSFIIEGRYEPDPRLYNGPHDWCLYYKNGTCGVCVKLCPVGAISDHGHDKDICADFTRKMAVKYKSEPALQPGRAGWCGLCQGAVPCQNGVPKGILD